MQFNLNNEVIIYPNPKGWQKIRDLLADYYRASIRSFSEGVSIMEYTNSYIEKRTVNGGFKMPLWELIHMFNKLFTHGTPYFEHMNIDLCEEDMSEPEEKSEETEETDTITADEANKLMHKNSNNANGEILKEVKKINNLIRKAAGKGYGSIIIEKNLIRNFVENAYFFVNKIKEYGFDCNNYDKHIVVTWNYLTPIL